MMKKIYLNLFLAGGLLLMAFLLNPPELWAQSNPVARCHDITVYIPADGSSVSIDPWEVDAGSSDADGPIVSWQVIPSTVDCDDVDSPVAVTLLVFDDDGNWDMCAAHVTVIDPLGPSAFAREVTLSLDQFGEARIWDAEELLDMNMTHDNCGLGEITASRDYFTCADEGYPAVSVYVNDVNGNTTTIMAWLHVVDDFAPVAVCQDITVALDASGQAHIEPEDVDLRSWDNCWTPMLMLSDYDFNCDDVGDQEVILSVRDEYQISTCNATVTVMDNTPPLANCFASIDIYLDENGEARLLVADVDAGSYDLCGIADRLIEGNPFYDCDDVTPYPHQATLVVSDYSYNEASCVVDVYVHDDDPPSIICPADITVSTDPGICGAAGVFLGEAIVTDNCSAYAENDAPGYYPLGTTGVWWQAIDGENIPAVCTQQVTVVDNEPPVLVGCPSDITVSCYTEVPPVATVTATDNCSGSCPVTFVEQESHHGNNCFNSISRNWSTKDIAMNQASCTQVITVRDDVPPVITCAPDAIRSTNTGECAYTVAGTEFDATATDNCEGINQINWSLSGATDGAGMSSLGGMDLNFGKTTVTWTAWDKCGNASTCQMVVDVNKVITISQVTVTPDEQQYSDPVTFTATIQPGFCEGAGHAATHVTFYVGMQPMGEPVPLVPDGGLLVGIATYPLLEKEGYEGSMDPDPALNPKLVKASFSGVDPDFVVINPSTTLTVLPENACAYYSGVYYASTGSILSNEATVVLAATLVEEDDGYPGDFINSAFVQFLADGRQVADVPVVPVTEVDGELPVGEIGDGAGIGSASYEWPLVPTGVYDINVKVLGYYTNTPGEDCDGEALVTVGKPTPDFITGGGYVVIENSMGLLAGTPGLKNNFGFVVKYNKRMTNLQGNLNTIVRRMEPDGIVHLYKIKANVMTSLAVVENTATFTGKANIQEITDPMMPVSVAGNGLLQFTLTDKGEPGVNDMISITLWKNDGGLWFTTLWDAVAYRPAEQLLDGGNLVVHSAADDGGETPPVKPPKKKVALIGSPASGEQVLQVYPNPFSDKLYFGFTPENNAPARLEIFDGMGRKLTTLLDRNVEAGIPMRLEYQPRVSVTQMLFYRLTLGNHVHNGKVIYRK